jgi:hypothetical protein
MLLNTTLVPDIEWDFSRVVKLPDVDQSVTEISSLSSNSLLDLLAASILPDYSPTLFYRVKGEDTLTFGDQIRWYIIKRLQGSVRSLSALEFGMLDEEIRETIPKYYSPPIPISRIFYRNPEAVITYLACHPEIEDFLNAAWPFLEESFGTPVDIVLEVMSYPEEDYDELVGWIQSTDSVYEGLEKFEQFEDEWLLDNLDKVIDKFSFNIETK